MKRSTPIRQPRTRHEAEAMIKKIAAASTQTRPSIAIRRLRSVWLQTHTLG